MEDEQECTKRNNCASLIPIQEVSSSKLLEHQEQLFTTPVQDETPPIIFDGSFGLITDDVIEHCIIPFVEYRELILTIPLVCSKWRCMTNKESIWFDIVLKETKFNSTNLYSYVNNCKFLCKIKTEKVMVDDESPTLPLPLECSSLLSDNVYILKRLLYIVRDYFPTSFLTPSEDPERIFHLPELVCRDPKNPNVLIYNKRTAQEEYRAFAYDINLMTNKRIPNLPFKPPQKKSSSKVEEDQHSSSSLTTTLIATEGEATPSTTNIATPPKLTSNYLLEDLIPVFYFEVETMIFEKPEATPPITPVTPLSSTSTNSSNSFWKKMIKKKVKSGRNSLGVLHSNYLGNRQVGWDDLSAGFHSDDGGIFLEEGGSKFKVNLVDDCVVGDVLGCGFSSHHKAVFFTHNGNFLTSPVILNTLKEEMRFGLGFWKDMIVKCNFGQEPFKYDTTKALDDITNHLGDPEHFLHHLYDSEMTYTDSDKISGLVEKLTSLKNRIETANLFLADIQRRIMAREMGMDSDEEIEISDSSDEDYVEEENAMSVSSAEEQATWDLILEDADAQSSDESLSEAVDAQPQEENISEDEDSFNSDQ